MFGMIILGFFQTDCAFLAGSGLSLSPAVPGDLSEVPMVTLYALPGEQSVMCWPPSPVLVSQSLHPVQSGERRG